MGTSIRRRASAAAALLMLLLLGCGGGSGGDAAPPSIQAADSPGAKILAAAPPSLVATSQRLNLAITAGSGKLLTVPASVECSSTCIADIEAGMTVSVRAIPAPGYVFAGWDGACTDPSACSVTMSGSRSVSARFSPVDSRAECMAPRSTNEGNPAISATHPKVLLSNAAWKACLQQRLLTGSPQALRFKALVDSQVGGANNYGYEAWWSALMYQLTGEERYATHAIAMTDAFVAGEENLIAGGDRASVSYDSYLYVGEHIGGLATVYDWTYDRLTPQQRARWIAYANQAVANVWNHEGATWGGRPFPWTGWSVNNPANNYYYSFLRATMTLGLATYGENPSAGAWLAKFRVEKLDGQLFPAFNSQLQGGGSREGTGYGTAMFSLWRLYDWWERSTGERIAAKTPHTLASISHQLHSLLPTLDRLAPTGDHSRDRTAALFDYHRDYLLGLITLFPEERVSAVAKAALEASTVPRMRHNYDYVVDFMYAPPRLPDASLTELSSAYWGPGTGQLMTRSDWGTGAGFVNFICGPYTESHAHRDQGSFVFFRGDWLAWDSNIRSGNGLAQAEEKHNLVRLVRSNGTAIQQVVESSACQMKAVVEQPQYTYAVADVTPVYNRQAGVTQVIRELLFLKPGVVIVADRVTTGSGVSKVWTLNLPAQPELSPGRMTMINGSQRLEVHTMAPANAQGAWVGGERVEIADSSSGASFFLNVLGANGAVQQATRSDDGTQTGVRVQLSDGRVATVRFDANAPGGRIELRAADGSLKLDSALTQGVVAPPVFTDSPVPIPAPDPTPTPTPDPKPPVEPVQVSWLEPVTGPAFVAPATVRLSARAAPASRVVRMELWMDGQKKAEAAGASATYTATQLGAGSYRLEARAVLDDGSVASATPFVLRVDPPAPPADTSVVFRQGLNGYAGVTDLGVSNQYVQYNGGRGIVSNDPTIGAYRIAGSGGYEVRSFLRFDGLQSLQGRRVLRAEMGLTFSWGGSGYSLNVQALTKAWLGSSPSFGWTMTGAGERWAVPGGGSSDWETGPVATITGFTGGEADTRTVPLAAALVQRWIDQPQTNHGLALVPAATGKVSWLRTSEDAQPAWRPTLRLWLE